MSNDDPKPAPGIEELNCLAKLLDEQLPPPGTQSREALVRYANALLSQIRDTLTAAQAEHEALDRIKSEQAKAGEAAANPAESTPAQE